MASETVARQRHAGHGTYSMYTNQVCRCPACRAANSAYSRDRKAFIRQFGALTPGWRDQLRKMRGESDD